MSDYPFKESNYYNEVNYIIKYKDRGVAKPTTLKVYYRRVKIGDQYGNQYDNQYEDQYEQYPGSLGDQYIDTQYYGKIKNPYANDPDNDYIYYDDKGNEYTFYEVKTLRELHPAYVHGYIDIEGKDIEQDWGGSNITVKEEKVLNKDAIFGIIIGSIIVIGSIIWMIIAFNKFKDIETKENKVKDTKENTNKNTNENKTNDALLDAYNKAVMETPYDPYNNVPTLSYEPDNTSTITYEATHDDMDNYTENIAETNNTIETVT